MLSLVSLLRELSALQLPFLFQDIALHKAAVQSSTKHNGFASRGVDGNFKFHWSDKSCTHTDNEMDPWWRVDLGREYIVTGIKSNNPVPIPNFQFQIANLIEIIFFLLRLKHVVFLVKVLL